MQNTSAGQNISATYGMGEKERGESVYNKSGDDVYKQQMMDNFRFPIVGVDRVVAKPSPTIRGPRPRDGLRIRMPSFYRKRLILH